MIATKYWLAALGIAAIVEAKNLYDRYKEKAHTESIVDKTLKDTFPASDPTGTYG